MTPGIHPSIVRIMLIQKCIPSLACKKTAAGGKMKAKTTFRINPIITNLLYISSENAEIVLINPL
jgi:hypothetical protein